MQEFAATIAAPAVGNWKNRDYCIIDSTELERLRIPPSISMSDCWLDDVLLNAYTWCVVQNALAAPAQRPMAAA